MRQHEAEALILSAGGLGLSYGEYVARLVTKTPLPMLAAERAADRAALMASTDNLAALSVDLAAFVRLLRMGSSAEVEKYRHRIETVDIEIRRHLDRVSALIASV
jgi:hypothetical protein